MSHSFQVALATNSLGFLFTVNVLGLSGCDDPPASGKLLTQTTTGGAPAMDANTGGTYVHDVTSSSGCPRDTNIAAPSISTDCAVSVRDIDPVFTCGTADCAVKRSLDLTCDTYPEIPQIAATADGALVLAAGTYSDQTRLMTVDGTGGSVEEFDTVSIWVANAALSVTPQGTHWLFDGRTDPVTAFLKTGSGWVRSSSLGESDSYARGDGELRSAHLVRDDLGYVAYSAASGEYSPHLVTWDGSCWKDQTIGNTVTFTMAVASDAKNQPWVAWLSNTGGLYLRDPGGSTQDLGATIPGDGGVASNLGAPLRLLPGGMNGTSAFPLVAAKGVDGVRIFSSTTGSDWRSVLLPDPSYSISDNADCPDHGAITDCKTDPCVGSTSCTREATEPGDGFDLVRTQSGRTFVARMVYSSNGSYKLYTESLDEELQSPTCVCNWNELSGSGTADLMLMRLTDSTPIVSHFRFDMGDGIRTLRRDVVMASRGDTILVAAQLSGDKVPKLTYIEIDSTMLP